LTDWYVSNARDLPWRRTRDPYAIWISEIMLQQTRVAAVIPYYEKFLSAYPNAAALAAAPEEQVLTMWAGLGYYSRARNLQRAARLIAAAGGFPQTYESIRELPGIGDYTAAAVSSIAFGLPHAAVDGNVRRVIVRLLNDDAADAPKTANLLLDRRDPGRWNQAMMELGATVCTPRDPRCPECPVRKYCAARKQGTQQSIPSKRVKPQPERLERVLLIVRRGGRIMLTPSPRVAGFWDLPELSSEPGPGPGEGAIVPGALIGTFRHTITHRYYTFRVHEGKVVLRREPHRWVAHQKLHEIPLSTTAKKALRCLGK
jgi:A/G-specific adenine glycosylase